MSKVSVIAKLTAQDGKRDQMVAAFRDFLPAVEAEAGTEVYSIHLDGKDANVVWVFELYADRAALDAHSNSEGMGAFVAAAAGLFAGAPEISVADPAFAKGLAV